MMSVNCRAHCEKSYSTAVSFLTHMSIDVHADSLMKMIEWLNWAKIEPSNGSFDCNLCEKAKELTKNGLLDHVGVFHQKVTSFLTKYERSAVQILSEDDGGDSEESASISDFEGAEKVVPLNLTKRGRKPSSKKIVRKVASVSTRRPKLIPFKDVSRMKVDLRDKTAITSIRATLRKKLRLVKTTAKYVETFVRATLSKPMIRLHAW